MCWLLAHNSADYLPANSTPSPTRHFWTLSVEEQFYIALPLVLLVASVLARALRLGHRRVVDVTSPYCTAETCSPVIDHVLPVKTR